MSTLTFDQAAAALAAPNPEATGVGGPAGGPVTQAERELVNRVTMGLTGEELGLVRALGLTGYIDHHLNVEGIDDSAIEGRLAVETPEVFMTAPQLDAQASDSTTQRQFVRARILRAVFSRRQLLERAVDMWVDHFNIDLYSTAQTYLKPVDEREVIRAHALSPFPQLVSASAHSPSMLKYLDNDTNRVGRPNENYARELLELHTLGVDAGYTQQDVQEVARCFTGWTFYGGASGANSYLFRFNAANHDVGQKIVMGNIIPAGGGQQDGETVLQILGAHSNTARFVAKKLLVHFWGYDPPQSLVEQVAGVYKATGGNTRAMIREVLNPYLSPARTPKYKRPLHYAVSVLRALGATVSFPSNTTALQSAIASAGHAPYAWGPPDGYPDEYQYWVGLLLPRWNFAASLMQSSFNGTGVDVMAALGGNTKPTNITACLGKMLYGGAMPADERGRLLTFLGQFPSLTKIREAFGLAASGPGFQWY